MLSIVGTNNGRIFMGGRDGCLYELYYQADDGWFSKKCRKINHSTSVIGSLLPSFLRYGKLFFIVVLHLTLVFYSFSGEDPLTQLVVDHSRNILYSLSKSGTIQVFDLG